jgi:hypothetical protein
MSSTAWPMGPAACRGRKLDADLKYRFKAALKRTVGVFGRRGTYGSVRSAGPPPPPANRTECDPEFPSPPTTKLYFARNKKRPFTNFIRAEITSLGFFLYHVENTPDDSLGCPGTWLFEIAWAHFTQNGIPINGVRGSWTYGTNLMAINALKRNNQMSLPDAAMQTWAFGQASSKGFTTVHVLDTDGVPGNYTSVDVVFLP